MRWLKCPLHSLRPHTTSLALSFLSSLPHGECLSVSHCEPRRNEADYWHKNNLKLASTQPFTTGAPWIILGTERGRLTSGTMRKLVPPHETTRKGPPHEVKNRHVHNSEVQPKPMCWSSISKSCTNILVAAACYATASLFKSIHVHLSKGTSR